MDKDEAMKISVQLLSKLMASDNADTELMGALAYIHTAEAEKDYGKIYTALEAARKFIVTITNCVKTEII